MGEDDTTYHGAEYSVHSGILDGHEPSFVAKIIRVNKAQRPFDAQIYQMSGRIVL